MTDKDRIYIRKFRWKFWLRWKYLGMMKRFAKEIHRDIEREKDTLIRCRKDMLEQKAYIDSAKSDNERKVHEIMYKQQCSFERTANFSGFLSLTTMDLFTVLPNLYNAKNEIQRNYYARLVKMYIYELTEDVTQLLAKDEDRQEGKAFGLRPLVEEIGDEKLVKLHNEICGEWNDLWGRISKDKKNFKDVRIMTVAHRDHDFLKQFESIQTVSWGQTIEDFGEFYNCYSHLTTLVQCIYYKQYAKYRHDMRAIEECLV